MPRRAKSTTGPLPATAGGLLTEAVERHRKGQLEQAAALYRQVLAAQADQPDALHLLGLICHARGEHGEALALIERALAVNSTVAAFHLARGAVLLSLGRATEAAEAAGRALDLDAGNAEAHNILGNALMALDLVEDAVAAYRRALTLRPGYAEALNNLGSALRATGRLAEAEAALRQAVALRRAYPAALANLGLVLQEQGRYHEALAAFDQAVAADPGFATARGNRAMLLLLLGRLDEGFADYEWRWRMPGFATPSRNFAQPAWDGTALAGRTLFVHAEQGLGSAIQFVRYAGLAAAAGGRVVLECHRPLQRLFAQSLVAPRGPVAALVVKGEEPPDFDCQAPLMSLPHLLGTTLAAIPGDSPYLSPDPAEAASWRERLAAAGRPRIGLVWAGNRRHENDRNRSMPAAELARLVDSHPAAAFFSLQVPGAAEDLAAFPPDRVEDLAPHLPDFAATAAVIANLDLVVSVDTAVAHLAGALGHPVWLLLPYVPEWRWLLGRNDSPWYPSMRLFRQSAPGNWPELIERVGAALRTHLAGGRPA